MKRLTALDVTRLPVGMHHDGDGLYLQVTGATASRRSWVLEFTLGGRTRYLDSARRRQFP